MIMFQWSPVYNLAKTYIGRNPSEWEFTDDDVYTDILININGKKKLVKVGDWIVVDEYYNLFENLNYLNND